MTKLKIPPLWFWSSPKIPLVMTATPLWFWGVDYDDIDPGHYRYVQFCVEWAAIQQSTQ